MRRKFIKRALTAILCASMLTGMLSACGSGADEDETKEKDTTKGSEEVQTSEKEDEYKDLKLTLDESITYQTIESFGASGAWWSQDVGGWNEENIDGLIPRDEIVRMLFDKENGIGLSNYRYNIGAGTADSEDKHEGITDPWRMAQSFETAPGEYDWSRDENAQWVLAKAKELGVTEFVFFCNSPLTRLTKNGKGCGDKDESGNTSNLAAENYRAFSEYVLDVVEHFKAEGYPIKYISPVNEPQWEWTGGQEGCHFEPEELVAFYNVFLDVMEERNIEGLELSAPELGEWGNTSFKYLDALYNDERLKNELKALDIHSYWSDDKARNDFLNWAERNSLTDLELKMSEWCEMKNGKERTMTSALELAKTMHADLTKLSVTSWQYWIAVSCYNYRDGLIYVVTNNKRVQDTKRLWAMGNYSRFIRPGYVRIEASSDSSGLLVSAYKGTDESGKENTVLVFVNSENTGYSLSNSALPQGSATEVYVTDEEHSLEKIQGTKDAVQIPPRSVVTIKITN